MFDRNGDGRITKKELSDSLENLGIYISDNDLVQMFEKIDVNKDECLDLEEFSELYQTIMAERDEEEDMREAFNVFDQNGDGFITVEELRSVLVSLGLKQGRTVEDCKKMIRKVDVDGDGMATHLLEYHSPFMSLKFPLQKALFLPLLMQNSGAMIFNIGFHGQNPNLVRFCKWLKSELETQGMACFVEDIAKYSDSHSHEITDRIICSATSSIFLNHFSIKEIIFLAQKKNDMEWKEGIDGLMKSHEFKREANESNWRSCVSRAAGILRAKLGRKSVAEEVEGFEELSFPS
ncbi:hypothetical protein HHK36_022161 [Tetracentron sinense]|uniref:EF-hand domain-containing protein n=1 Tax=Tetracentron sinense TaxID=13715 RepID=A0A834YSD8_TETSI|nr:hypothetical protein HHK36_022161 [Tetracentron sinense]